MNGFTSDVAETGAGDPVAALEVEFSEAMSP